MALIIDQFAGGGGASMGITMALGRGPDVAINHRVGKAAAGRLLDGRTWDEVPQ